MPSEPDTEIRLNNDWGYVPMCVGILFCGFALYYIANPSKYGGYVSESGAGVLLILIFGILLISAGRNWLSDTSAKLSLSTSGLNDHRTNKTIAWVDYQSVRLYIVTLNGNQSSATMYIKITDGRKSKEVAFDVDCLDQSPQAIVGLVQSRAAASMSRRDATLNDAT